VRKRSAYRPKPMLYNAIERALWRSFVLEPADRANLKATARDARAALLRGEDARVSWRLLADAINVATALAEAGICSDAESVALFDGGHEALGAVADRQLAGGSWTLRAAEIAALDAAIERHAIQLDHCSRGEWEAAREKVRRRTEQALHGNAAPGVAVYGRV
jgi:hypothetical protein